MGSALAVVMVFGGLIFIHEFGHFIMAKRAGVRVDEFAIGFGPRLAGWRRGETAYNLRLMPLGGFVRMAGMYPDADQTPVPPGRGFNDKPVGRRAAIVLAGPFINILLAAVLFMVAFTVIGIPEGPQLEVDQVQPGKPAAAAGFRSGDRILAIDGKPLADWSELKAKVAASPGRRLTFLVEREGRRMNLHLTPERGPGGQGFAGISPSFFKRVSVLQAVPEGVKYTAQVITDTLRGVLAATRGATEQISGPVRIGKEISEAARISFWHVVIMAAVLSASLGLVNLFPIPALDGARLVFLGVEALRGRPVSHEKENLIHFFGFAFLILVMLGITYRDIVNLITG